MKLELSKEKSLVNFGNSILKFYGCETFHNSYENLDNILKRHGNKKVCLVLLDGFGKVIVDKYKLDCPTISSSSKDTFYSSFPPTTVCATNCLLLAKYPCETGYMGWVQYFYMLDKLVDVFPSKDSLTGEDVKPNITQEILNYPNIIDMINKNKVYKAQQLMSFSYKLPDESHDLEKLFKIADETLENYDFNYIYSSEPDSSMHKYGTTDINVQHMVKRLDNLVNNLAKKHPDYLFLIIADHGMVDILPDFFSDNKDLQDSITNEIPILEGRFAGFFIKNEEKFIKTYNEYYKDKYILYSKDEILNDHIFGYSDNYAEVFLKGLADYYLISKSQYCFASRDHFLKGHHAGSTKEELEINLSVLNYEK